MTLKNLILDTGKNLILGAGKNLVLEAPQAITGTGAISLGALEAAGAGNKHVSGSGAVDFGALEVDGSSAPLPDVYGTGAVILAGLEADASGNKGVTGAGAVALGAQVAAGATQRGLTGEGQIYLGEVEVAGTDSVDGGEILLPAIQVSGRGVVIGLMNISGGRIRFTRKTEGDSAWFDYSAPTGTIRAIAVFEHAGGVLQKALRNSGTFEMTGLSNRRYRVYVVAFGSGTRIADVEQAGISNVIDYVHSAATVNAEERVTIEWRTDYNQTWQGGDWDERIQRARVVPNSTAHWLQWRLRGCGSRPTLRNVQVEAALHGMAEQARE